VKRYTLIGLVLVGGALAFLAPDWLAEHPTAAVALGVGGALVIVGLALLVGVVIGGYWTRRAMADGAQIALKAQAVNDTWDAKKTAAFAGLMREGAAIGRQSPGGLPALPALPGQTDTYLPPLVEFGQAHFQVIDNDGEVEQ
jgi:hypothetical protein